MLEKKARCRKVLLTDSSTTMFIVVVSAMTDTYEVKVSVGRF
jgi:hypothetical protein